MKLKVIANGFKLITRKHTIFRKKEREKVDYRKQITKYQIMMTEGVHKSLVHKNITENNLFTPALYCSMGSIVSSIRYYTCLSRKVSMS